MSYAAPYAGTKVVDLSQGVAGPYCAMMLAQYGANVIKVEPIETGDWSRTLGTRYDDQTAYSIPANLGKRSIALDLKQDAGRDVLWRLTAGADVFMQGFRPGVIDRLGFGYPTVAEREPRIIYVSVSGFGQQGPLRERPAMDPVLQAYTGLMAENRGEDGIPHRIPIIAIDMSTGIYTFGAVAAALHARQHLPKGRHIDSSLMQAAAGLQVIRLIGSHLDGDGARPTVPPNGVYKTSDGWISITVVRLFEWEGYCRALDVPQFLDETRFSTMEGRQIHAQELDAVLRPLLQTGTTAMWSARLAGQRVMHEALNSYNQFLQQPHLAESGSLAWVNHPHVPQPVPLANLIGAPPFEDGSPLSTAPAKGQHGEAILREHGFSAADIASLVERGVVVLDKERVA